MVQEVTVPQRVCSLEVVQRLMGSQGKSVEGNEGNLLLPVWT